MNLLESIAAEPLHFFYSNKEEEEEEGGKNEKPNLLCVDGCTADLAHLFPQKKLNKSVKYYKESLSLFCTPRFSSTIMTIKSIYLLFVYYFYH